MPASFINDPAHWRQRAEEARTIAEQMSDLNSKDAMLRIAKDYERLPTTLAGLHLVVFACLMLNNLLGGSP